MQSDNLSGATKAELRRQKILAKKAARMAYAAGNHSKLPTTEPIEPTSTQPATPVQTSPSSDTFPTNAPQSYQPPLPPTFRPEMLNGDVLDMFRIRAEGGRLRDGRRRPGRRFEKLETGWMRILMFAVVAIARTIAVRRQDVYDWNVSMVELFLYLEVLFVAPLVVRDVCRVVRGGEHRSVARVSLLGVLMGAGKYVVALRNVAGDFSVFMLAFLCTWYVLEGRL